MALPCMFDAVTAADGQFPGALAMARSNVAPTANFFLCEVVLEKKSKGFLSGWCHSPIIKIG